MSDLLSGLPTYDDAGRRMKVWRGQLVKADDVREALSNPTDEQVKQAARAMARARERNPRWRHLSGWERDLADARAVLAAAAGGDE